MLFTGQIGVHMVSTEEENSGYPLGLF